MADRNPLERAREHIVVSPLRPLLDAGERVTARLHVRDPDTGHRGIVAATPARCVVYWGLRHPARVIPWEELTGWRMAEQARGGPLLRLHTADDEVAVQIPASSRARMRKLAVLLARLREHAPAHAQGPHRSPDTMDLRTERRDLRAHTRRLAVTVLGVLVILLGGLFASPFVPGPGALTALAGLAILAREYDWASDIHQWFEGQIERVWEWRRRRRRRRKAQRDRQREREPQRQ